GQVPSLALASGNLHLEDLRVASQFDPGPPDVAPQAQAGVGRITSPQRVEEEVVLGVDDPEPCGTGEHHVGPPVVLGGVPKPGDGREQWLHVATGVAQEMELAV